MMKNLHSSVKRSSTSSRSILPRLWRSIYRFGREKPFRLRVFSLGVFCWHWTRVRVQGVRVGSKFYEAF